jgi:hypothetical protein
MLGEAKEYEKGWIEKVEHEETEELQKTKK